MKREKAAQAEVGSIGGGAPSNRARAKPWPCVQRAFIGPCSERSGVGPMSVVPGIVVTALPACEALLSAFEHLVAPAPVLAPRPPPGTVEGHRQARQHRREEMHGGRSPFACGHPARHAQRAPVPRRVDGSEQEVHRLRALHRQRDRVRYLLGRPRPHPPERHLHRLRAEARLIASAPRIHHTPRTPPSAHLTSPTSDAGASAPASRISNRRSEARERS